MLLTTVLLCIPKSQVVYVFQTVRLFIEDTGADLYVCDCEVYHLVYIMYRYIIFLVDGVRT